MEKISKERAIRALVKSNIEDYAQKFSERHISEFNKPDGTINMKIHNVFIAALGKEIQYYTALVRSLDSSLGKMLERLAVNLASLSYEVTRSVEGNLYPEQTKKIAEFLESYKDKKNPMTVNAAHYQELRNVEKSAQHKPRTHQSDYHLYDKQHEKHYLIELKIGGDLDNKKARAEKQALFEQYAILANRLSSSADIYCFFATAYNRFGEGKDWNQGRVLQFFSEDELLIGKDFWNFVCKSDDGYNIVINEYKKNAHLIKNALEEIKNTYLG